MTSEPALRLEPPQQLASSVTLMQVSSTGLTRHVTLTAREPSLLPGALLARARQELHTFGGHWLAWSSMWPRAESLSGRAHLGSQLRPVLQQQPQEQPQQSRPVPGGCLGR